MRLPDFIRDSGMLRQPLLTASRLLLTLLERGPGLLRRAMYDAMPVPYLVTGHPEKFVVSTTDKVIGRELFLHGEFDFEKLRSALAIMAREGCSSPSHLIDVGANIGSITIPALKRGLMQTATAIEPHPGNLRLLRANIALNGLENHVSVLAQAVGNCDAVLHLYESATNSGNHSIGNEGIPVLSSRLDDLPLPTAQSLLWMDIEGYEGHALLGAARLLVAGVPVVCEFNAAYLGQAGGMDGLVQSLANRAIFDLKQGEHALETTLEDLMTQYPGGSEFTDILAIEKKALRS